MRRYIKYNIIQLILILLLTNSNYLFAQPSGYLGKRFTLSYEQLTGPNVYNLINGGILEDDYYYEETNANLNYIGSITADYILTKTKSRGVSLSLIDQTMYFGDSYEVVDPINSNIIGYSIINNAKLSGVTVGLYAKYFKRENIAPLGEYYKFEFLYSNYKIKSMNTHSRLYTESGGAKEIYNTLGFAVTFGKNRIFWERVVISSGITVGFRLNLIPIKNALKGEYNDRASEILKDSAHQWHGQNLLYNLHLGVGLLLF
ncbi:MAG: hypothetical protein HY951_16290 [Bacteroidia bacterium]|nr:hypothetical protein [Bacteroidia bacterium]